MKDSFVLYTEINEVLAILTNEQKGILFQAIVDYESTGEIPEITDQTAAVAFVPVKQSLDKNNKKYEKTVEQRIEASRKAAEARKKKEEEVKRILESANMTPTDDRPDTDRTPTDDRPMTETHQTVPDNDYVNVNGNVNVHVNGNDNDTLTGNTTPLNPPKGKRETQEQIFDRLVEDQNIGLEMENVLREWLRYKAERRDTYKETGMKSMITQVQNAVYRFGEVAVMNRIRDAMANSWKGMNLDKMGEGRAGQKNDAQDFINRWMNA